MQKYCFFLVICLSYCISYSNHAQQLAFGLELSNRIVNLDRPWGAAFLPDGRLIVSEMEGTLKLFGKNYRLLDKLEKPLDLDQRRIARFDNSGAFDVAVDPNFDTNGFIYWSYAAKSEKNSFLKVSRIHVTGNKLVFDREVFSATPANDDRFHFGGALIFDHQKNLLIAIGERFSSAKKQGQEPVAQNPADSRGKIWSIKKPAKVSKSESFEAIQVASGLRNVQAMEIISNNVWISDHGPILGDELNILKPNANYGWPYLTTGNYKDKDYLPEKVSEDKFVAPVYSWQEFTMAPSGLLFYQNSRYRSLNNRLLVSGLSSGRLLSFTLNNGRVVDEQELILGIRMRDIIASPDGRIFILSDETQGRVIELLVK
ncbi:PQQ-dependent sugar dehydrogenase [Aliikangiella marina]|uniref:PQQ-dependent sugar dehydrogenase n=1 Tax=Aliikangiella marina TaxID=1712262 RepID=UPI00163D9AEB|nr:PQQ-dependent sugar dehydrogenase [Aliikangiella marina]